MTDPQDKITDIVPPILRNIQEEMANFNKRMDSMDKRMESIDREIHLLRVGQADIRADIHLVQDAIRRVDVRLNAMESYQGGFYSTMRLHDDDLSDLRGRIEALERQSLYSPPPS